MRYIKIVSPTRHRPGPKPSDLYLPMLLRHTPRPIIPNQDLNAIIAGLNCVQRVCTCSFISCLLCLAMPLLSP